MGQTIGVNIAKRAYDVEISQQFDGYSAVRIYVGTDDEGNLCSLTVDQIKHYGNMFFVPEDITQEEISDSIIFEIIDFS